jgi:hypothetical protein
LQSAFGSDETEFYPTSHISDVVEDLFDRWIETEQPQANLLKLIWVLSMSAYAAMDIKLSGLVRSIVNYLEIWYLISPQWAPWPRRTVLLVVRFPAFPTSPIVWDPTCSKSSSLPPGESCYALCCCCSLQLQPIGLEAHTLRDRSALTILHSPLRFFEFSGALRLQGLNGTRLRLTQLSSRCSCQVISLDYSRYPRAVL